jgi:hypothetical protein
MPTPEGTAVAPAEPAAWRAWCYLIWLSWQRQARAHLMVWIALGLLAFMTLLVAVISPTAWDINTWRAPPNRKFTYRDAPTNVALVQHAFPQNAALMGVQDAARGAFEAALRNDDTRRRIGFVRFSWQIVFSMFTTFLLPLWSLSFATEALGREREQQNLLWVLTRPLSRPAIYLAKFLALLPWCLAINLGGFALLCLAAGPPGHLALRLYWPAVFWGALAFAALFHLMGAWFRRASVVAILYSFFLETVMGNLPGHLKRASISFYTRCMMFEEGGAYGVGPARPDIFMPVSGTTAWVVLAALTVLLLTVGMFVFRRAEYLDLN